MGRRAHRTSRASPRNPRRSSAYRLRCNAHLACERCVLTPMTIASAADFVDLLLRQARKRIGLTTPYRGLGDCAPAIALALSALSHHVGDVVGLRTEEEVIGPDAELDIAAMAHHEPIGDWAVCYFPRHAMNEQRTAAAIAANAPIAVPVNVALPQPTAIALLDQAPETFG